MTVTTAARPAGPEAVAGDPTLALPTLADRVRGTLARAAMRLPVPMRRVLSGRPAISVDGQTLDATLQFLLAVRGRVGDRPLTHGEPAEARARHRREILSVRGPATPVGAVRTLSIPGGAGALRARYYAAPGQGAEPLPLLVFLHGGGFVIGDLDTHDEVCRLLARHARHHVLSVAYRLAPEHPCPAAIEDAEAAFRWAQRHAGALDADPSRIAVGGDSAGGNLAAVVAQRTARERPPIAQLLLYPPTDHVATRPSHALFDGYFLTMADRNAFYAHYTQGATLAHDDPRLSPLRATSLAGLPPAFVVTAGFDVLRDEGEAYAAALQGAGTPCRVHREPTLGHGFVQLTGVCQAAHRATVSLAHQWRGFVAQPDGTA